MAFALSTTRAQVHQGPVTTTIIAEARRSCAQRPGTASDCSGRPPLADVANLRLRDSELPRWSAVRSGTGPPFSENLVANDGVPDEPHASLSQTGDGSSGATDQPIPAILV